MNHDFQEQLRRAHAERAWYIAGLIADGIVATMRGASWTARRLQSALQPRRRPATT